MLKTDIDFSFHVVFRDANTPDPFIPDTPNDDGEAAKGIKPDHVYMDAMGFGMGCSCLQVFKLCLQNHYFISSISIPFLC